MKVNKFIFPVDSVVSVMKVDIDVSIILSRSFSITCNTLINVQSSNLTLKADDEVEFDISHNRKFSVFQD